jgi:hypothetical protein
MQGGRIIQRQNLMGKIESLRERFDGRRVPAGQHGTVPAFQSALRDQGARVPGSPVEHPGLGPAHDCARLSQSRLVFCCISKLLWVGLGGVRTH